MKTTREFRSKPRIVFAGFLVSLLQIGAGFWIIRTLEEPRALVRLIGLGGMASGVWLGLLSEWTRRTAIVRLLGDTIEVNVSPIRSTASMRLREITSLDENANGTVSICAGEVEIEIPLPALSAADAEEVMVFLQPERAKKQETDEVTGDGDDLLLEDVKVHNSNA